MSSCSLLVATPPQPGAIAILQLTGDCTPVLAALCGVDDWPIGRMRLVDLGGIDDGMAGRLAADVAQVMPHGGPRVVQRLIERLTGLGADLGGTPPPPRLVYPESSDDVEALALATVARARSPLAVDLLLDQPRRWRSAPAVSDEDRSRSRRLDRLVEPPSVVVAGPANVGKSTLSNRLLGRSMSIALDQPGTTRDYTSGRIEFAGLVVDWHDTPGLRATGDPLERRAIEIAARLFTGADLVIAMTDAEHDWPGLDRRADLRVGSKSDLGPRTDADLCVSSTTGAGLEELVSAVREMLVPAADIAHDGPWVFDERLGRKGDIPL